MPPKDGAGRDQPVGSQLSWEEPDQCGKDGAVGPVQPGPGWVRRSTATSCRSTSSSTCLPAAHATGQAGDICLCHPFIVHTATWPHRGTAPRMIAQPAVHVADGFAIDGSDPSPVARAIVAGLAVAD